jgi:hypothetical protein
LSQYAERPWDSFNWQSQSRPFSSDGIYGARRLCGDPLVGEAGLKQSRIAEFIWTS